MHFRAILLPLVALAGRFLYGISRLPSLQSLSAMMLQLMNLQMVSMVLATYYHWQACVLLTQATICPCTLLKLRDTFQLLPKAIKILFMHWLWMKVEQFLSPLAQKRYNMAYEWKWNNSWGFFTFETVERVSCAVVAWKFWDVVSDHGLFLQLFWGSLGCACLGCKIRIKDSKAKRAYR